MNYLTGNQNLQFHLDWEEKALNFWQEIAQCQSKNLTCNLVNETKLVKPIAYKQSPNFWEELALQRV